MPSAIVPAGYRLESALAAAVSFPRLSFHVWWALLKPQKGQWWLLSGSQIEVAPSGDVSITAGLPALRTQSAVWHLDQRMEP